MNSSYDDDIKIDKRKSVMLTISSGSAIGVFILRQQKIYQDDKCHSEYSHKIKILLSPSQT